MLKNKIIKTLNLGVSKNDTQERFIFDKIIIGGKLK